jgi:predicted transposase YbfD/YdcC
MATVASKTTLWEMLARVPDHRDKSGRRFPLRGILGITLAATLAGRDSLAGIARWGRKLTRRQLVEFGIDRRQAPCHATYHNVFKGLEIAALEHELGIWACGLAAGSNNALAIDGKVLRASRTEDYPSVHLLAAFSHTARVVVGQVRVLDETNESKAALHLLKEIKLAGTVVTGDAIFAQKEICREITEREGDYFFVVKENQATLKEDIEMAFAAPLSPPGRKAVGARSGAGRGGRQKPWPGRTPDSGVHRAAGGIP